MSKRPVEPLINLDGEEFERQVKRVIHDNPPYSRPWTKKEVEIVKRLAGKVPNKIIVRELQTRTLVAVEHMVRRLNG